MTTFFPADQPTSIETGTIREHPAMGRTYTRATLLDDLGLHVFTSASSRYASTLVVQLDDDGDPMLWDNDACLRVAYDGVTATDSLETLDAVHDVIVALLRTGEVVRLPAGDQMDGAS